jgi:hypothetical protein
MSEPTTTADGKKKSWLWLIGKATALERELEAMTTRCGQIDGLKGRIAELNVAMDAVTAQRDELLGGAATRQKGRAT